MTTDDDAREQAVVSMRYLLDRSPRATDADGLAQAYSVYTILRREMLWRRQMSWSQPVSGVQRLRDVLAERRGAIVHFMHLGHFTGLFGALSREGAHTHVAAAPHYWTEVSGRRYTNAVNRAHIATVRAPGVTTFSSAGSFRHILDLLAGGEAVALANDVQGTMPCMWLGRTVLMAAGLARVAMASGAPVVPVTAAPDGHLTRFSVQPAVEPGNFHDASALHAALLAVHEPAVLAWPEAVDYPRLRSYAATTEDADRYGVTLGEASR